MSNTVGGIIETKEIGLRISDSGTYENTEILDGKLVLKKVDELTYYEEGSWTSDVIDLTDNFAEFGKLFATYEDTNNATIAILTRTSSDGITFDEWVALGEDGSILSEKKQFIQVKVNLFAGYVNQEVVISEFNDINEKERFTPNEYINTENGLKLERNYIRDMNVDESWNDEGILHKLAINKDEWRTLDKLDIVVDNGEVTEILQGEFTKTEYVDLLPLIKVGDTNGSLSSGQVYVTTDERGDWILKNTTSIQLINSHGFDKDITTYLRTAVVGTVNQYIEIEFPKHFLIGKYKFELGKYNTQYSNMASWDILARVNGEWITVHSGTNARIAATVENEFTPVLADAIRIKCTAKHGSNSWGFDDFYLYEMNSVPIHKSFILHNGEYKKYDSTWQTVSTTIPSKEEFLLNGMDSLTPLLDRVTNLETNLISSPLDELEGIFEIVTLTNDISLRQAVINASSLPQFIKLTQNKYVNKIENLEVQDNNVPLYLINKGFSQWYTYNTYTTDFEIVNTDDIEEIRNKAMNSSTVNSIGEFDWSKFNVDYFNIGILLDNEDTIVNNILLNELIPINTKEITKSSFYILNTTARIDVMLEGTLLRAILSDDDLGRVQYRVLLNNQPYRYNNENEEGWSDLLLSPYNINMNLYDESIIIPNDNNTVRIEFRDAFGTEDYWESIFFAKKQKGKFTYAFIM